MANHASAKKRSRQNKTRNTVNSQYLSKFRTALNKFQSSLKSKNDEEIFFGGSTSLPHVLSLDHGFLSNEVK